MILDYMQRIAPTLVLLVLPAACGGDQLGQLFPAIAVCTAGTRDCEPPIALGAFRVGDVHQAAFDVRNLGDGSLTIDGVELVSGGEGVLLGPDVPTKVLARSAQPVPLTITPVLGTTTARFAVSSNDEKTPRLEFDLLIEGVAPALVLCPEGDDLSACAGELVVDVGEVRPTQATDVTVQVRNAGTAVLDIAGAELSAPPSADGELEVLTSTSPGTLEPGAQSPLVVRYRPLDGLPDEGQIIVTQAYEGGPPAILTIRGHAPPNDPPVAVAYELDTLLTAISGEVDHGVWLDARGSTDPEGDPLRFAWSVVARPFGSTNNPETPEAALTRFAPDVLGEYTLQLQVRDSLGLVSFADVTLAAEPRYFLTVEISWGPNGGDVDLHLVPEGATLFSTQDCYFAQPTVDLGVVGEPRDDATLVADSEASSGTELLVVPRPAVGTYQVWAHYFDSRGRTTEVVARVLRDDGSTEVGTTSDTLGTDCEAWLVGTVSWPDASFTPAAAPHESQCFGDGP